MNLKTKGSANNIAMANYNVKKHLRCCAVNVNSICNVKRRYDLQSFLNRNNIDIALISETKLNHRHKVSIQNYDAIRNDRQSAQRGGGTAIIIRNDIRYYMGYQLTIVGLIRS